MKDQVKPWRELPNIIDLKDGHWSWGRGGLGTRDWQWHIQHVDDDLNATCYVLPDYLSEILRMQFERGENAAQLAMRRALGM